MAMELYPDVTISAVVGGYVVRTEEYEPETDETKTITRACLSVDEVLIHVRRTIEGVDKKPSRVYERIEKAQ